MRCLSEGVCLPHCCRCYTAEEADERLPVLPAPPWAAVSQPVGARWAHLGSTYAEAPPPRARGSRQRGLAPSQNSSPGTGGQPGQEAGQQQQQQLKQRQRRLHSDDSAAGQGRDPQQPGSIGEALSGSSGEPPIRQLLVTPGLRAQFPDLDCLPPRGKFSVEGQRFAVSDQPAAASHCKPAAPRPCRRAAP
jgi:hypothetical protein